MNITMVSATEILDSRGVPTLEVTIGAGSHASRASVPSGKSTGQFEAVERRDRDSTRYGGRGVTQAAASVDSEIAHLIVGRPLPTQSDLDRLLIDLDGTGNKRRLGANAILGVSLAAARLRADLEGLPLFESLGGDRAVTLPVPCFNVINGGAHAHNGLDFQEFMLVPAGPATYAEALRAGAEIYHTLAVLLERAGLATAVGDEGGFAPAISHPAEALDWIMRAIEGARYRPGEDILIALDPAASGFYRNGVYMFAGDSLDAAAMSAMYATWLGRYPVISIEDGLAEDDRTGWRLLTDELGSRVQLVGDDIFVSDAARVQDAAAEGIGNAVLLKPNQIGTVSEIMDTAQVARICGFRSMMSHRSGETDDSFIADLAVALGTGQIKAGAPARGERIAKYNQLLRIERMLGHRARFGGRAAFDAPVGVGGRMLSGDLVGDLTAGQSSGNLSLK